MMIMDARDAANGPAGCLKGDTPREATCEPGRESPAHTLLLLAHGPLVFGRDALTPAALLARKTVSAARMHRRIRQAPLTRQRTSRAPVCRPTRAPAGIANDGATCYVNAAFQVLANLRHVREAAMRAGREHFAFSHSLLGVFRDFLEQSDAAPCGALRLRYGSTAAAYTRGAGDARKIFVAVQAALEGRAGCRTTHTRHLAARGLPATCSSDEDDEFLDLVCDARRRPALVAGDVFHMRVRDRLQCPCGKTARLAEKTLDHVKVDLAAACARSDDLVRLETEVARALSPDVLGRGAVCAACSKRASWTRSVQAWPHVLCVSIARTRASDVKTSQRVDVAVCLPVGGSDPRFFSMRYYMLAGAICHVGDTRTRGHYYALVHKSDAGESAWFLCDDDKVFTVTETAAVLRMATDAVYLVYVKDNR